MSVCVFFSLFFSNGGGVAGPRVLGLQQKKFYSNIGCLQTTLARVSDAQQIFSIKGFAVFRAV